MSNVILIRVDANEQTGAGHAMRCLALAQAWRKDGGEAVFVMSEKAFPALQDEGFEVCVILSDDDASELISLAKKRGAEWVIVDGYNFKDEYHKNIKDADLKLFMFDDFGQCGHYYADIILNQNISARSGMYENREDYTRLLLGCNYALLRSEFLECDKNEKPVQQVARKILVTMGAADPDNVSETILKMLLELDDVEIRVIVGKLNSHYESMQDFCAAHDATNITLCRNANMPEMMAWADVAISAAGSTCWELAYMGVPTMTVVIAENQRAIAEMLDEMKIFPALEDFESASVIKEFCKDKAVRESTSIKGKSLIDGLGGVRIVGTIKGDEGETILRRAQLSDAVRVWEIANHPTARAQSLSKNDIPLEDHLTWYAQKLADEDVEFYVAEVASQIAGYVRYEKNENGEYYVSIAVDPDFRGRGVGRKLLGSALEEANTLWADICEDNAPSIKLFEGAGFCRDSSYIKDGKKWLRLSRKSEVTV